MGCNGCIYEDDCEGQCNIYDEELIDYEIESILNDIYEIIDNQ